MHDHWEKFKGKTIQSIQHHEVIGCFEIHFTDGCSIQVFAQEKASQRVTTFTPKITKG